MITDDRFSLQIVDHPAFKELLNFVGLKAIGLTLMSRKTLGRRIDVTSRTHAASVRDMLSRARWVATTADIWSARNRSFLGMTVHWIDDKYERNALALACRRFHGCHTFDRIAELICGIHNEFELPPGKLCATVTDNASKGLPG